ncbi:hypothetical protein AB0869_11550 [Micromonospora vinacea]|uniref:hypothetical protein n=1 Tax=Micromonospora vinacea TaxID=709878 RepID=UPI003451CDA4
MTQVDDPSGGDLTHPQGAYQIERYDPAGPPPQLPPGHGGIAVHIWCPPQSARFTLAPMVGVDGRPATYGFGRALIVVPVGERLVEVQYVSPQRSALVTVGEGEVVPLEYAASYEAFGTGALGRGDQRPSGRMPIAAALTFSLVLGLGAAYLGFLPFLLVDDAPTALLLVPPVLGIVVGILVFRRGTRRRR